MLKTLGIVAVVLFSAVLQAQTPIVQKPSKLTMMNGREYNVRLTKMDLTMIEFDYKNKHKVGTPEKIFSVLDSTGKISYIYYQDPLINRPLSIMQMDHFLAGFNDGRRYRWGLDFAMGAVTGIGGSYLGVLYGWSVPIAFGAINSSLRVHIKDRWITHPDMALDEYYQNGLKKKVKQRKALASFFGGATGMAIGTVLFQFLIRKPGN